MRAESEKIEQLARDIALWDDPDWPKRGTIYGWHGPRGYRQQAEFLIRLGWSRDD